MIFNPRHISVLFFLLAAAGHSSQRAAVPLGSAASFAILSKSGITDVPPSFVTGGNVGSSPITGAAILIGCSEVVERIYQVDAGGPGCFVTDPTFLTSAVSDMQAAYVNAAGRTSPDATDLGAGEIGGMTINAGLYKWSTNVTISDNLVLSGSATDVWIFQIAGNLKVSNAVRVRLAGDALAKNVFWQVAGDGVTIGTTARMKGTILSKTLIAMQTGAVLDGQAFAQTAVTLQMNTINSFPLQTPPPLSTTIAPARSIASVNLRSSANFAILSESGITDVPPSFVTGGNVGSSPITGAAILIGCSEVAGTIYEVNAGGPGCFVTNPSLLSTAVLDMQAAYTDAAGRTSPTATELGAGEIGGMTINAGLYKWSTNVTISDNLILSGSATDVWIFQVAGTLNLANAKQIILTGGALAKNVFWQVAGVVTIGTTATMQGTILGATLIAMQTDAVLHGRALAQTAVTLQMNTIDSFPQPTSAPVPTTPMPTTANPAPVNLGSSAGFAILSKSGITDVPQSYVLGGNVGSSPITGAAILIGCSEVARTIYEVDVGGPGCFVPNPTLLTTAVLDMQAAYTEAAGRTSPIATGLGAGEIGGLNLTAGVYKWNSVVTISDNLILSGSATDVWIFQVGGTLNLANAKQVILVGGALAKNVFWQVSGAVTIGTTASMQGTILGATSIAMQTGAILQGRALAQTAVTLQMNEINLVQ